jgi:hypothetical protein
MQWDGARAVSLPCSPDAHTRPNQPCPVERTSELGGTTKKPTPFSDLEVGARDKRGRLSMPKLGDLLVSGNARLVYHKKPDRRITIRVAEGLSD